MAAEVAGSMPMRTWISPMDPSTKPTPEGVIEAMVNR